MGTMIELNADIGEGGPDALIMRHVQRVSIASGGHAGDAHSMRTALALAGSHGVLPGAHPSYPDPANFGRQPIHARPAEISRWIVEQTRSLQSIAEESGQRLFHVKPHGALYNKAAFDEETSAAVIDAMHSLEGLALVVLAGSPLAAMARKAGLSVLEEAFADRRYLSSGQLAPRSVPGAVLDDPVQVLEQAFAIASGDPILTIEGTKLMLKADTLCLHGEGPRAAELARILGAGLAKVE